MRRVVAMGCLVLAVEASAQQPPNCAVGGFTIQPDDTIWVCRGVDLAPVQMATGGSAAWGSVTGTLSNQTDLQTALDGKQVAGSYATGTGSASGTNTGDQTITLTGNVTGSGTGSFAATIANGAVTLAKMADMATASVIYRKTAGTGAPEVQLLSTLKTDLALVKGDVGLGNVDNTADVNKSVSSAATLTTPRTINGASFNGSANITAKLDDAAAPDDNTDLNASTTAHGLLPKRNNSSTQLLTGQGAWATPAGGSSYRTLVTLGGDVTDSAGASTYVDCTGLSFAVTAGTRYHFYALIWYTSAASTTGSKWAINGPATTNMAYTSRYTLTATTQTQNFAAAYDIPVTANATSLTTTNVAILEGTILPSANGTVVVRFATEVDTSAVVCKAGSTLEWW